MQRKISLRESIDEERLRSWIQPAFAEANGMKMETKGFRPGFVQEHIHMLQC